MVSGTAPSRQPLIDACGYRYLHFRRSEVGPASDLASRSESRVALSGLTSAAKPRGSISGPPSSAPTRCRTQSATRATSNVSCVEAGAATAPLGRPARTTTRATMKRGRKVERVRIVASSLEAESSDRAPCPGTLAPFSRVFLPLWRGSPPSGHFWYGALQKRRSSDRDNDAQPRPRRPLHSPCG